MSARAAILLNNYGYENAMCVIGGLDEMHKAGFLVKLDGEIKFDLLMKQKK